jgi:hypothetical protein
VEVFGFDKVIHIFLPDFADSLVFSISFNAVPKKLTDFPILNHQLAFDAGVVLEAVGKFIWELWHHLEVFQILVFKHKYGQFAGAAQMGNCALTTLKQ